MPSNSKFPNKAVRQTKAKPKERQAKSRTDDLYASLRQRLSLSWCTTAVGREEEKQAIVNWMRAALASGNPVLYVSGIVGSGKTLVVHECEQQLRRMVKHHKVPDFHFIDINAVRDLKQPSQFYTCLWDRILDVEGMKEERGLAAPKAQNKLTEYFVHTMYARKPILLFVDEVDFLIRRDLKLIYNVFNWPVEPHSGLRVIAVSNHISLVDDMHSRILSRVGHERVEFMPYKHTALQAILENRINKHPLVETRALEMIAKKIGGISGDARRALQICSAMISNAEKQFRRTGEQKKMTLRDASKAIEASFQSLSVQVLRSLPCLKFLLVASIAAEVIANEHRLRAQDPSSCSLTSHVQVADVADRFWEYLRTIDFRMPTQPLDGAGPPEWPVDIEHVRQVLDQPQSAPCLDDILGMLVDLSQMAVVYLDFDGRPMLSRHSLVCLVVDIDDIKYVASQDKGHKAHGLNTIFDLRS